MLAGGVTSSLALPFFKGHAVLTVDHYAYSMSVSTLGRIVGGLIHYRFRYPVKKKFAIAMTVYVVLCVLEGTYMYLPYALILVSGFISGVLGVTSYNIRISSTQNYIDDAKRGRFNGIFQMSTTLGMVIGELVGGALGEYCPPQYIITAAMLFNFITSFTIMFRGRKHVKPIYNQSV